RAAGLRVGLYTSPHLVSFAERIQINRIPIANADLSRLVTELRGSLSQFEPDAPPTMFEVTTVLALRYFAEQRCDLVVWETGLGRRLDATNIVTQLASVITNIGWDHQQWLGDTLDKIAAEKAGIIKPGVPVITGAKAGHGLEVIRETAQRAGCPLTIVDVSGAAGDPLQAVWPGNAAQPPPLKLLGAHQRANAAVAVATVRLLAETFQLAGRLPEILSRGLAEVRWPGRLQIVATGNGRTVVLDGAHNPDGAEALRQAFEGLFPGKRPALILGVLADKDWNSIVRTRLPLASRLVLTPVGSERTLAPQTMLAA